VVGGFAAGGSTVQLESFSVVGNYTVGGRGIPGSEGISCNASAMNVNLEHVMVASFDVNINLTNWWNRYARDVQSMSCINGSIYARDANHCIIENVFTHPGEKYSIHLEGVSNTLKADIWNSGDVAGSVGIDVIGRNNHIECYNEGQNDSAIRVRITGDQNRVRNINSGGIIYVDGISNYVDPMITAVANTSVTLVPGSYDTTIIMCPVYQSATWGVIRGNLDTFQNLDYGDLATYGRPDLVQPAGYFYKGAHVRHSDGYIGEPAGWNCWTTGNPGVWLAEANLS